MARETRRNRLDQPLDRSRTLRPSVDPEVFGRASERVARFIGSWRFILYMSVFVVAWVVLNTFGPQSWRFDPWQFIGLTLVLSLQASYAAPLILLAQNRQSDRDRVQYQEDRTSTERLLADADYLSREVAALRIALNDVTTRDFIRNELKDLLEDLQKAVNEAPMAKPTEPVDES
ncbi:unannotated protein [freshwater metagenome]|uniref:Unannotated protein n=1 Tax=freshwater metagenome TaxID=449393 RepID=A0A6J7DZ78_9ZZZZ|nr:DUF1003 domain-containing protein [Actinomycetota bacterium]